MILDKIKQSKFFIIISGILTVILVFISIIFFKSKGDDKRDEKRKKIIQDNIDIVKKSIVKEAEIEKQKKVSDKNITNSGNRIDKLESDILDK